MWKTYRARLWSFDPSVDPPSMRSLDQFGKWVFVYRNPDKHKINNLWRQVHKERIVIDPGGEFYYKKMLTTWLGKTFETIYCVGTGDIFYVGDGLGHLIQRHLQKISHIQSNRDNEVNTLGHVKAAKQAVLDAGASLYAKASSIPTIGSPSIDKN